jgi:putative transposase
VKYSIKTYKFKLKLTNIQKELVDEYINTSRCLYNLALETRLYAYSSHKVYWNYYDLSSQLTELRKEFDWIKKLPSAFKSFFKGSGFPKFAKKDKYNSVTFKNVKTHTHNRLKIEKLGSVKYFNSREMGGKIQRATITRKNGEYFVSVMVRTDSAIPIKISHDSSKIGLDVGVAYFLSDSNGNYVENPRILEKYSKQLRIEQSSLSRKKKGSNNRKKQKLKVAKLHEKITNTRKDFQQKLSTEITNQNDIIIVEDIKPSKMLNSKYLNKQISDASWSSFLSMLEYKCKAKGKIFEKINPAYTSQTCNACGIIDKKSRISQSEFVCISCGNIDNADQNAAKNILGKGITSLRKRKALA